MSTNHKKSALAPPSGRGYRTFFALLVIGFVVLNWWLWRVASSAGTGAAVRKPKAIAPYDTKPDAAVFATYAGSKSCQECHEKAYALWTNSHHALAERPISPTIDRSAFVPTRVFKHGTQISEARLRDGHFEVVTLGFGGKQPYPVSRVIGVSPLRQFLVPQERGFFQVTEIATDTAKGDWFDVYNDEDRLPGEWGHWTGRGMTWNTMCAYCHNTRVRKNYDAATDTYATAFKEHGVGCEACHGPMADHVKWSRAHPGVKKGDPTLPKFTWTQTRDYCGACHARRNDLTGDFHPGEEFFDHFLLTIPDDTDTYYPDGQVRDENFEFTAFLGSRMHLMGVKCMDCHDVHSGKVKAADNSLCLRCHLTPLQEFPTAPKIDPATHSFHKPATAGDFCVDCHMPQTVYMARQWRRDHGYTIPDPLLTKQYNIPNACNRCHTTNSVDWAVGYCDKWYGPRMNRPTRVRAQWVAEARAGATNTPGNMLRILNEEKIPLWRAVAAGFLKFHGSEPGVGAALVKAASDPNPLVRYSAAQSLEFVPPQAYPAVESTLRFLLVDPSRAVRVRAAWSQRRILETNSVAAQDLLFSLVNSSDHPTGQLQLGMWHLDRGDLDVALDCFKRAVEWDKGSAALRHALAVAYSMKGKPAEAVHELETAVRLAPRDPELRYKLGLALNEINKLPEATKALEEAVRLSPQFARAWYNLGLAYSAQEALPRALDALRRAESFDATSAQIPYALATIYARMGDLPNARDSARRALEIQPAFPEAEMLLRRLSQ